MAGNSVEILLKYFELTERQFEQFSALQALYEDWNQKINVISRKDIENIYVRHVLHSLAIAKYFKFKPGTDVMDLGCGGGFPGIPLAIMFPEVNFTLIDGTKKKITVVNEVIKSIGLKNATGWHERAEYMTEKYDFIVSRAVANIKQLKMWSFPLFKKEHVSRIPNGLICLKGGNLKTELKMLSKRDYHEQIALNKYFEEEFFEEKYLIYLQR